MAKKKYISPLYSGGLVDGGEHTEPYTNSEEIYSPDRTDSSYPDFIGLDAAQISTFMSAYPTAAQALAWDSTGDGCINLDEYLAACPSSTPGNPE